MKVVFDGTPERKT